MHVLFCRNKAPSLGSFSLSDFYSCMSSIHTDKQMYSPAGKVSVCPTVPGLVHVYELDGGVV